VRASPLTFVIGACLLAVVVGVLAISIDAISAGTAAVNERPETESGPPLRSTQQPRLAQDARSVVATESSVETPANNELSSTATQAEKFPAEDRATKGFHPREDIREKLVTLHIAPTWKLTRFALLDAIAVRLSSEGRYTVFDRYATEPVFDQTGATGSLLRGFGAEHRHFFFHHSEFQILEHLERAQSEAALEAGRLGRRSAIEPEVGTELWYGLIAFLEETLVLTAL